MIIQRRQRARDDRKGPGRDQERDRGGTGLCLACFSGMGDHQKSDSGKGIPGTAEGSTTEAPVRDGRLIPGGSIEAARTPIGMNAVDREDLPSYGRSTGQVDYTDTPETDADRPPHPPEPDSGKSTAESPGITRPQNR